MSEQDNFVPGADLFNRVIRLNRKHPSDRKMSSAFLRCFPCKLSGGKDELDTGMTALIIKGTATNPCRTKCYDCGRHMGWFGHNQLSLLHERLINE